MASSCILAGGCRHRFLMRTPYRTLNRWRLGMRMVGMLLALFSSCVFPLLLYASLPRTYGWLFSLISASCLGLSLLLPWLMADSHLCKLSLQLIFVTLYWSTTIELSLLEFADEDCFGHAYVFYPCYVANPAQLHLKQDGLYAGQVGSIEDFFVRQMVLQFDAKDGAQALLVKPLQ